MAEMSLEEWIAVVDQTIPAEAKPPDEGATAGLWSFVKSEFLPTMYSRRRVFDPPPRDAAAGDTIKPVIIDIERPMFTARTIAPQHRAGLRAETEKLIAAGFVREVPSDGFTVPKHPITGLTLWIHGHVAALKPWLQASRRSTDFASTWRGATGIALWTTRSRCYHGREQ